MTCKYITPKTNSCTVCLRTGSGGRHGSHHLGCEKSKYFGMRHEQIYQMKEDSKAKSRDGTRPGAKPTKTGAKGLSSISSFFGKKSARVGVSQPPRATEPPSGSSSTSGAPPRPPSPAPGLAARAMAAVKNYMSPTKELVDNGTFWRRYAKYVATVTFSDRTIEEMIYGADGWASRWPYEVDETTNETLGTIATDKALSNQRTHCADISDVESHNIRLKRLPNQRHTLQVVKKTRGGKVEAFHTVLGDFANGNMQPRTAQMLVMEGAYRFSIDRDRELDYQLGANSLDGGHYRSWLRLEANRLAEAAGFEKPYPNEPELGEDSGERFCYDYWLEQRKREQKYEYTSSMKYCPCERCVARRKTCKCAACTAWRFLPDNIDETFLGVAEAIDSVEEPDVAGSEMEVDTETTVRPQGVTAGFMESLPMSTTPSMSTTLRSEADKLKGKKKLADVRRMAACPACTCGKVKENADENARRAAAGQKNAHVRGPQSYCAKTCEQWSWIVREGYRKDDRK